MDNQVETRKLLFVEEEGSIEFIPKIPISKSFLCQGLNIQRTIAMVALQTFYLGKLDLLTVYLGKLIFLSVTDFSRGNLPRGNFILWSLDMSREQ